MHSSIARRVRSARSAGRRVGVAAASAAAHLLLLWAGVARPAPEPAADAPEPRAIDLAIFPRAERVPAAAQAAALPSPRRHLPPNAPSGLATPAPAVSASGEAGPAPAAGRGGGALPGDQIGQDLRRALRTSVGCSHADYARLSAAEQDVCDERLGRAARQVPPLGVVTADAGKQAGLDKAAAENEAWRRYREGGGDYPGLRSLIRH